MEFPHRALAQIKAFVAQADPSLVSSARAAELVAGFAELERLAAAGKVLFASRAGDSNSWARAGHRSAASWLAERQGSSLGDAMAVLETSRRLEGLEATKHALVAGEISEDQAREVTLASEKDPGSEKELIQTARTQTLKILKSRTKEVLARSNSEKEETERYIQIQRTRFLRHWSDYDGSFRLEAKLTPDAGARVAAAIEAEANVVFEEKRSQEERESPGAYRADALVRLLGDRGCAGTGSKPSGTGSKPSGTGGRRTDTVVIRVDAAAFSRGHTKGAELCEVAGVGAVPVAAVRRLLPESFVKILIKDAVDVLSVCHIGRLVSAHVQSALEERDPICVVPGCDLAYGLETHHWREDYSKCRTTSLDGICRVCARHHGMISYEGFRLIGGPGKWELVPPKAPPEAIDSG